MTEAPSGAMIF